MTKKQNKKKKMIIKNTPWQKNIDEKIQKKISIVSDLINKGSIADAEKYCLQILQIRSQDPDAFHLLGIIALRSNNFEDAVLYFNNALSITPKNAKIFSRSALRSVWGKVCAGLGFK